MRRNGAIRAATVPALLLVVFLFSASEVSAHCDGMDGPVVKAAQKALETGKANYAPVWVQPAYEAETNAAFRKAASVRKLSGEAGGLADMYFFETLVRLRRAGEGGTYTGLKPAGRDLGPVIPAAAAAVVLDAHALDAAVGLEGDFADAVGVRVGADGGRAGVEHPARPRADPGQPRAVAGDRAGDAEVAGDGRVPRDVADEVAAEVGGRHVAGDGEAPARLRGDRVLELARPRVVEAVQKAELQRVDLLYDSLAALCNQR